MHSTFTQPSVPPDAPREPSVFRLVRRGLWIVFALMLTAVVALAVASVSLATVFVVTGTVALILVNRYVLRGAWTRLAVSYCSLTCVFVYLAIDDTTIRRPLTLDRLSPVFPGAEESHEVLMRYGKAHPLGRDFRFQPSQKIYQGQGVWKPADPQWSVWLTTHRTELESGWAKLEPVRAWWNELNGFERIGDLTHPTLDAEIMTFQPVRALTQHACAIASLQALDGNGDAAVATLLPIVEVSRKLEPSSRTLVRSMIARVSLKMALDTAGFVLDTAAVSPESRARLSKALEGGFGGEAGARHIVSMEYAWAEVLMTPATFLAGQKRSPWRVRCLTPFSRLVFNPRRTINLYGDLTADLQEAAARRDFAGIDIPLKQFSLQKGHASFKNFAGPYMLATATPAYKKIIESYWTTEDLRIRVRTRLQT